MRAATSPRSRRDLRLLVVDAVGERIVPYAALPDLLGAEDLVVVNDAATLPASLTGERVAGVDAPSAAREPIELRLVAALDGARCWLAAVLGAGDYRTPTEARPPPPTLRPGDRVRFGSPPHGLVADVVASRTGSPRLVEIVLGIESRPRAALAEIWSAIYAVGKPIQYAHVPAPLALWDVQNVFAGRPWAVEMPSAGRGLSASTLASLERRGIRVARVTHAAGLSSIGDADVDALLPLPERFEVPSETLAAIARAHARGGRVVAIGTSVVRALESAAELETARGVTSLVLGPHTRRRVVDSVLTGVHDAETTHHQLLRSFVSDRTLARALHAAEEGALLGHEFGDAVLFEGSRVERDAGVNLTRPVALCLAQSS